MKPSRSSPRLCSTSAALMPWITERCDVRTFQSIARKRPCSGCVWHGHADATAAEPGHGARHGPDGPANSDESAVSATAVQPADVARGHGPDADGTTAAGANGADAVPDAARWAPHATRQPEPGATVVLHEARQWLIYLQASAVCWPIPTAHPCSGWRKGCWPRREHHGYR